jgi:hypothetical protein
LVVGAVAFVVRFISRPEAPRVVSERLGLGESIVVTHLPAPATGRRARKQARASGTAAGAAEASGTDSEVGG